MRKTRHCTFLLFVTMVVAAMAGGITRPKVPAYDRVEVARRFHSNGLIAAGIAGLIATREDAVQRDVGSLQGPSTDVGSPGGNLLLARGSDGTADNLPVVARALQLIPDNYRKRDQPSTGYALENRVPERLVAPSIGYALDKRLTAPSTGYEFPLEVKDVQKRGLENRDENEGTAVSRCRRRCYDCTGSLKGQKYDTAECRENCRLGGAPDVRCCVYAKDPKERCNSAPAS